MPATDAPDWQRVVTTVTATGAVPDAPDWQRIVVGPSGTPVGGGGGTSALGRYAAFGILGITAEPLIFGGAVGHAGGNITFQAFAALGTGTAKHFYTPLNTGSNSFTPNENYVAIYDSGQTTAGTMTRLAVSAAGAAEAAWTPPQQVSTISLGAGAALTAGQMYYMALLNNGAAPAFYEITQSAVVQSNVFGTNPPFTCSSTATFTTMPSTLAFSATTRVVDAWLMYCGV